MSKTNKEINCKITGRSKTLERENKKLNVKTRDSTNSWRSTNFHSMENMSSGDNTRNFIAENVSYIQKLQKRTSNALKRKSNMELKKQYFIYNPKKIEPRSRSKSSTNQDSKSNKKQKKSKKKDKFGRNRSPSPELDENVEPQTFIETFCDVVPEEKPPKHTVSHKHAVHTHKKKVVNVRDFGCQCGDPKRTFFFEDGSNIHLYVPSKEVIPKKKKEITANLPYVVSSRYLLFKKKVFDQDMARQLRPVKKVVDRKKEHQKVMLKEFEYMDQNVNEEPQKDTNQKKEVQQQGYCKWEDRRPRDKWFEQKYQKHKSNHQTFYLV